MISAVVGVFISPAGKPIMIAIAVLAALSYAYHQGFSAADLRCEAESLKSELAAMTRDVEIAQEAEADAEKRMNELTLKAEGLNAQLKRNKARRKGRNACTVTGADAQRLRDIR